MTNNIYIAKKKLPSNSRPSCNKTDRDGHTTQNAFKTGVKPNGSYSNTAQDNDTSGTVGLRMRNLRTLSRSTANH